MRRLGTERGVSRSAVLVALMAVAFGLTSWAAPPPAAAQQSEGGALMIVMDGSGSMLADDGTGRSKVDGAKAALRAAVAGLPEGAVTGLLVYGQRTSNTESARAEGCRDTEVVVPPAPLDRTRMTAAVDGFTARGFTPIGRALQDATAALPPSGPRTVLLVSDGIDTCAPPNPCTVAAQLGGQGVDLRVETVGFQVDGDARRQLECIAQARGGQYSDASDSDALAKRLVDVASRAARGYQLQGNRVTGGASYQDAPLLAPGTYGDTAVAREQLWYAVDLAAGQELTARSTLVIDDRDFGGVGALYEVQIVGPDLKDLCCDDERGYEVNVGVGTTQRTVNVSARSGVVGADGSNAEEPGRYYVRVTTKGEGAAEYPVEVDLAVTGAAPPSAVAAAPPTVAAPVPAPDDRGDPTVWMGVAGVLGTLVAALTVAVVVLLRRARSGAGGR